MARLFGEFYFFLFHSVTLLFLRYTVLHRFFSSVERNTVGGSLSVFKHEINEKKIERRGEKTATTTM